MIKKVVPWCVSNSKKKDKIDAEIFAYIRALVSDSQIQYLPPSTNNHFKRAVGQ